jgi:hypothetical protein
VGGIESERRTGETNKAKREKVVLAASNEKEMKRKARVRELVHIQWCLRHRFSIYIYVCVCVYAEYTKATRKREKEEKTTLERRGSNDDDAYHGTTTQTIAMRQ